MNPLSSSSAMQRSKDDDQLKLLSVFHFVVAGLALCGIAFVVLHYVMMSTVFAHPEQWSGRKGGQFPTAFFNIFKWFYLFMGLLLVLAFLGNLLSGIFLRQRRHRVFSLVVAGLNCPQIPFGTVLGIFTFIVLLRDTVRHAYDAPELLPP